MPFTVKTFRNSLSLVKRHEFTIAPQNQNVQAWHGSIQEIQSIPSVGRGLAAVFLYQTGVLLIEMMETGLEAF